MPRLEGTLKHYDWGSKTAIAELRGIPPSGEPEAELWFGPGKNLPWLVKILAIQKPLSLQLHPNAKPASRGFQLEEARGIKQDDPNRLYRDKKSKSELVCALTPFKAFCGLREIDSAIESAEIFDLPKEFFAPLKTDGEKGWGKVIAGLFSGEWNQEIEDLLYRCRSGVDETREKEAEEIIKIAKIHKIDASIMLLPFMNYHELGIGDAIHVEPGVAHIYIQGMDLSHVALYEILLNKHWFDAYKLNTGDSKIISISLDILSKVLAMRQKNQIILINFDDNPDKLNIQFKNTRL